MVSIASSTCSRGAADLRDFLAMVVLEHVGEDVLVKGYLLLELVGLEDILVRITASVLVELMDPCERCMKHYSAGIIMAFITDRLRARGARELQ